MTEAAASATGVPASELIVRDGVITHPKSKKQMSFADIVKSGKATKTFTPDELKAIKLKTPDQYTMIGVSVPQLDRQCGVQCGRRPRALAADHGGRGQGGDESVSHARIGRQRSAGVFSGGFFCGVVLRHPERLKF